jgi:NTP pyrophosphatase (non-canonical NTP hydrolase)
MDNQERLEHELADMLGVLQMLAKTGAIDLDKVERLIPQKIEKKKRWLIQPVDAVPTASLEQKAQP